MDYEVKLVETPRRSTAVVKTRVAFDDVATELLGLLDQVWAVIRANNVPFEHNLVVYDRDGLIEAGVQIDGPLPQDDVVVASETPAGHAVTTVHWGEYSEIGAAHQALEAWCTAHSLETASLYWEVYGDWQDDPAQRRTDVYHLLRS